MSLINQATVNCTCPKRRYCSKTSWGMAFRNCLGHQLWIS